MLDSPWFFGYGSLVNCHTHDYLDPKPAQLEGWRRAWVQTEIQDICFLSAYPVASGGIDGLIACVPQGDWEALDEREHSYCRHDVTQLVSGVDKTGDIQVYSVPMEICETHSQRKPILLSYLDVVLSGYERVFGYEGVRRFVDTTDGWDRPIINDRGNPIYPRAVSLKADQKRWIDDILEDVTSTIM